MKKHAISHSMAVLVCTVASGSLIRLGHDYYPRVVSHMIKISTGIKDIFKLRYSAKNISVFMLAIVLAAIWGVAFSFMHSDKKKDKK